ncbi:flagellar motor switch phosphatase FliY [Bacillus lacus]|uniref:Flagellar motor switch phosphatase FliY n=1 Tax=Metabacillus lacus TaxID=1983721 RepID=A0A7X2IWT7_9BACI|nr:flagellar motor switch phosphatase FliY [Metabacillus lacus]MRX70603.1 flagellar motor switch phosphatase FliY [Metabacillus lacus]
MVSNGMLSQDEIDALLRGAPASEETGALQIGDYLSPMEEDAIGEIGNISFGSSATALSSLLNQKVEITTPTVSVILKCDLAEEFPYPYVGIEVDYTEGFTGSNLLIIKQHDAAIIADLMIGGDGKNPGEMLDEIQLSAVQEAMNQMMGSAATSMSTVFNKRVDISPPTIELLDANQQGVSEDKDETLYIQVSFRLKIGQLIDSNIMQLLPLQFARDLISELLNPQSEIAAAEPAAEMPIYEEPKSAPAQVKTSAPSPQEYEVKPVEFAAFSNQQGHPVETGNLEMLLDIPLQVTVELGRTKRSIKEILELSSGSIIELDKLAGEPVDILVNSKIVAVGEVVVIDENFGVRVTDIVSQKERLNKLR